MCLVGLYRVALTDLQSPLQPARRCRRGFRRGAYSHASRRVASGGGTGGGNGACWRDCPTEPAIPQTGRLCHLRHRATGSTVADRDLPSLAALLLLPGELPPGPGCGTDVQLVAILLVSVSSPLMCSLKLLRMTASDSSSPPIPLCSSTTGAPLQRPRPRPRPAAATLMRQPNACRWRCCLLPVVGHAALLARGCVRLLLASLGVHECLPA